MPTARTWAGTVSSTFRTPGDSGRSTSSSPVTAATRSSRLATPRSASISATNRHFPEGARCLGLNGAEIVFNPSATVAGLSRHLWKLEQPAHAVANGYFLGANNRVGTEAPWNIGRFYGSSYFVNPRGEFIAEGSEDKDEVVVADLDLNLHRRGAAGLAVLPRPPPRGVRGTGPQVALLGHSQRMVQSTVHQERCGAGAKSRGPWLHCATLGLPGSIAAISERSAWGGLR